MTAMVPPEIISLLQEILPPHQNPTLLAPTTMQAPVTPPLLPPPLPPQLTSPHHLHPIPPWPVATDVSAASSVSLSSNSATSDEDHQLRVMVDERRRRRMISNRESARRSRMRKQRHLDELWSQVVRLRIENQTLVEKLNEAANRHERVVRENARLKEEASDLRQLLTDSRIDSPGYHVTTTTGVSDLEEVIICNEEVVHHSCETVRDELVKA